MDKEKSHEEKGDVEKDDEKNQNKETHWKTEEGVDRRMKRWRSQRSSKPIGSMRMIIH